MKETKNRSFTPEEIAEITAETVEETVKDFDTLLERLVYVAHVTQEVMHLLSPHDNISILHDAPGKRGGLTPQKAAAWQICTKLREKP